MDIFIYSDESGVFDKVHNSFFTFGGLVFLSKEAKDSFSRKYLHAENVVRQQEKAEQAQEIKAKELASQYMSQINSEVNDDNNKRIDQDRQA